MLSFYDTTAARSFFFKALQDYAYDNQQAKIELVKHHCNVIYCFEVFIICVMRRPLRLQMHYIVVLQHKVAPQGSKTHYCNRHDREGYSFDLGAFLDVIAYQVKINFDLPIKFDL